MINILNMELSANMFVVLLLILGAYRLGYKHAKSLGDMVIGYRNDEIESLKRMAESYEEAFDSLKNKDNDTYN